MTKPTTIEECMEAFKEIGGPEDQVKFFRLTKEELIEFNHGLGQWIRNNWDLWKGGPLLDHMKDLGFIHPDDMSQSLIVEYWNSLHNQPSELEKHIAEYKAYWDSQSK